MLFTTFFVNGQEAFSCGTPSSTTEEIAQFYQSIGFNPTATNVASGVLTNYDLPIHLYVINAEDGTSPTRGGVEAEYFYAQLPEINSYFSEVGFSFYLCKITNIYDDFLFNATHTNVNGQLFTYMRDNDIGDINSINVFIVDKLIAPGLANTPQRFSNDVTSGFVFLIGNLDAKVIAHELGHYFGLVHTFENTTHRGDGFDEMQNPIGYVWVETTPDNKWNPYHHYAPDCASETDGCGDCATTGDMICDTPADPNQYSCSVNMDQYCIIEDTYNFRNQDQGGRSYTYEPGASYTNIMSYYGQYRYEFSNQQNQLMLASLSSGEWTFLTDSNEPECDNIDLDTDIYFSRTAMIERGTRSANGELVFVPLKDMNLINTVTEEGDYPGSCYSSSDIDGQVIWNDCGQYPDDYVQIGSTETFETGQCFVLNHCSQLSADNGLSGYDIIQVTRHILAIQDLNEHVEFYPYNYIAADVNKDGEITTFDVIHMRKVILGIYDQFPNAPSWRTLPKYALTDQFETFRDDFYEDPFSAVWTYAYGQATENRGYLAENGHPSYVDDPITLLGSNPDTRDEETWSFRAIKTGDVNFSNMLPNDGLDNQEYSLKLVRSEENSYGDIRDWLIVPGQTNDGKAMCIEKNQTFTIEIVSSTNALIEGYQMEVAGDLDDFVIEGIGAGDLNGFTLDNFYMPSYKSVRSLWFNESTSLQPVSEGDVLYKLYCKASREICDLKDVEDGMLLELVKDHLLTGVWGNYGGKIVPIDFDFGVRVVAESKKHQLNTIFPNPISGEVNFEFKLSEPATVEFLIIDAYGNQKTETEYLQEGTHTKLFNDTSPLQPGVWNYLIQLGDESHSGILLKL